jgi:hypothetical protein
MAEPDESSGLRLAALALPYHCALVPHLMTRQPWVVRPQPIKHHTMTVLMHFRRQGIYAVNRSRAYGETVLSRG